MNLMSAKSTPGAALLAKKRSKSPGREGCASDRTKGAYSYSPTDTIAGRERHLSRSFLRRFLAILVLASML